MGTLISTLPSSCRRINLFPDLIVMDSRAKMSRIPLDHMFYETQKNSGPRRFEFGVPSFIVFFSNLFVPRHWSEFLFQFSHNCEHYTTMTQKVIPAPPSSTSLAWLFFFQRAVVPLTSFPSPLLRTSPCLGGISVSPVVLPLQCSIDPKAARWLAASPDRSIEFSPNISPPDMLHG